MRLCLKYLACLILFITPLKSKSQEVDSITLTLNEAIEIAQRQSLNAFIAQNTYLEGYWQFRTYRAILYPSMWLSTNVFSYSTGNRYIDATQDYEYRQNTSNDVVLSLRQNIVPTGGEISINSGLYRNHNINEADLQYRTNPIDVTIRQPLNGYNEFKWNRKLEPLEYEIAKKNYIRRQQTIAQVAVNQFFQLAAAEVDLAISTFNYSNADTLYRIGKGRFEIGTITQDELLNLELTLLNAEKSLTSSRLNLRRAKANLNSFLRMPQTVQIVCKLPEEIPELQIEIDSAVKFAFDNNPEILDYQVDLIRQDQAVARTRAQRFDADLVLSYGIDQVGYGLDELYTPPYSNSNAARVGLSLPLLDWGNTKGNYLMAKSRREVTKYEVEQNIVDFERTVINTVMEFNLQNQQLQIAKKAEEVGKLGFDVTKQRFLIGKVDVVRLNQARNGMVSSRKDYIENLRAYWNYVYNVQGLTLYDYLNDEALSADFEKIINDQNF